MADQPSSSSDKGAPAPPLNELAAAVRDETRASTPASTASTHRPTFAERAESALPPNLRQSVTAVPVTPGIGLSTYSSGDESLGPKKLGQARQGTPGGYFHNQSQKPVASPDPIDDNTALQDKTGSESGADLLRRMSRPTMSGRRESISEYRAANPDLPLSGNIISATFNIPHTLRYHKGSAWVSCLVPCYWSFLKGAVCDVVRHEVMHGTTRSLEKNAIY